MLNSLVTGILFVAVQFFSSIEEFRNGRNCRFAGFGQGILDKLACCRIVEFELQRASLLSDNTLGLQERESNEAGKFHTVRSHASLCLYGLNSTTVEKIV